MTAEETYTLTVNGQTRQVRSHPMRRLLDVLREDLHLTGTKEGCGEGECGACSVIIDGQLANSCLIPIAQAHHTRVCTIEDLSSDGNLHPVQEAFAKAGGAQCGICTPGMIMATLDLLSRNPHPTLDQMREALSGNLCRCTGYTRILEAVRMVSANTLE